MLGWALLLINPGTLNIYDNKATDIYKYIDLGNGVNKLPLKGKYETYGFGK